VEEISMHLVESWHFRQLMSRKLRFWLLIFILAHGHFTETTNIPELNAWDEEVMWCHPCDCSNDWKVGKIRLELGMISSFDLYQTVGHIKIMGVSAKIAELTGIGRRSVKGTGFRLRLSGSKVSWASNGHFPGWPICSRHIDRAKHITSKGGGRKGFKSYTSMTWLCNTSATKERIYSI
jgi:hypothetical protein